MVVKQLAHAAHNAQVVTPPSLLPIISTVVTALYVKTILSAYHSQREHHAQVQNLHALPKAEPLYLQAAIHFMDLMAVKRNIQQVTNAISKKLNFLNLEKNSIDIKYNFILFYCKIR